MKPIKTLITEAEIAARVEWLAKQITQELKGEFLVVALLKGSFVFAADLLRALHRAGAEPQVDFMTISSYGVGTTSGELTVRRDIAEAIEGRDVLLIDDILESGRTLAHARGIMRARGAKSTRIAVLLEKPGKREAEVDADFACFTIPDQFVVGYGLDHANRYRELPFIGVVQG